MTGSAASHEPAVVRLRAVRDADLPIFLAFQDDPVAAAMAAFPTRDATSFFAHWAVIRADPTVVAHTIVVDGEVVGDIVSWLNDGVREVGYWIGRAHWGRGFATAALRLLIDGLTDRPLIAHVALDNIGSRRVLEHCGFAVVGEEDAADGVRETILRLE
jgi:RimJ/RimL family protein N-acetyltransferase